MTWQRFARWGTIVLLVVGFVLLGSGGALADHWTVEVSAPEEGALGETIQLTATVHDASTGEPVEGAELVFFSSVTFAGVGGDIVLGEALTNDLGVAVFDYELRKQRDISTESRDVRILIQNVELLLPLTRIPRLPH